MRTSSTKGRSGVEVFHFTVTVHTPEELYPLLELESRGLRGVILNHALASDCVPIGQLLESADASLTA